MRKRIQRYGDATIIRFNKDEKQIYNIEEGQLYDIELCLVKNTKKEIN